MKPKAKLAAALTLATGFLALLVTAGLWLPHALADEAGAVSVMLEPQVWKWGLLAAAGSTGVSAVAAAYAVAQIGSAAMGTLAEKPELFGRLIIFVGLAEGIAIYGLIVSVLILNRLI